MTADSSSAPPITRTRRRNVITITPAGAEHFRKLDQVLVGIQGAVLAPLSAAERTELMRLLTRVLEYHSQP